MTTKNTHQMVFGKKVEGCPRCLELLNGAPAIKWSHQIQAEHNARRSEHIRAHYADPNHGKPGHRCYPVCTAFDW